MTRRLNALAFFLVAAATAALLAPPAIVAQQKEKQKAPPKPIKLPEGTQAYKDLAYGPKGERNTLDLYIPKTESSQPLPLIIWIHGGGWSKGSKDGANNPAFPFLNKGYAVASINYRLSQQAIFPAQIEDCKAAVRYLRANAKKYNLNPDAFGVWGGSAGGHLVALLGTTGDVKDLEGDGPNQGVSSRVQAVCDYFGPTDFLRFKSAAGGTAGSQLFGGPVSEKTDLARKASSVTYASKDAAPILMVHGDKDPTVPLSQSEYLLEALKKAGADCELIVVKGAGHGGPGFAAPEIQEKIAAFFDKNLKKK